jgi:hypothetical protein
MSETPAPASETFAEKAKLEEFKLLRGEIELRAAEQRGMERNVILLCASIYGFLLYPKGTPDPGDQAYLDLAWYLPSLFGFLALVRWRESVKMIEAVARYLRDMEAQIPGGPAWETFLAEKRRAGQLPFASAWYVVFWLVVCVGTLLLAYIRVHPADAPLPATAAIVGVIGTTVVAVMVLRRPAP